MHEMILRGIRDKEPHSVYHRMCAHMFDVVTRLDTCTVMTDKIRSGEGVE